MPSTIPEALEDFRAAGRGETSGPHIDRLVQSPYHNSNLRTTCVATMLSGGHAENALPQSATATVTGPPASPGSACTSPA
mgnify:CR=1 FL=1